MNGILISTMNIARTASFLVPLFFSPLAHGQVKNLVQDPGFEQRTDCPKHYTRPNEPLPLGSWWLPTKGTADLFTPCAGSIDVSVPDNLFGHQRPRSGEGYVGFGFKDEHYVEYVQTRLSRSLRKGRTYEVTFYVSLADLSRDAVAELGASLSKERLVLSDTGPLEVEPQVRLDTAVMDTMNWVPVSGRFVANGGEFYLTVGCFPKKRVQLIVAGIRPANAQPYAYYYLDDVQVIEVTTQAPPAAPKPVTSAAQVLVLGDVLFDHDRSELKHEAIAVLDSLVADRLVSFTGTLEITGHTDSTGTNEHNLQLSQRRADSVATYLRAKGINVERITATGAGSTSPVQSNADEAGRRKNRRVEIRLVD